MIDRKDLEKAYVPFNNSFYIDLDFSVADSTKELRSDFTFKTVHNEYRLIMELALVGNIGGTLGMLVGFSFIGIYEWIVEVGVKLNNLIKKGRSKKSGK